MITCRRHYIDTFLTQESSGMKGEMLDIGGKKTNKRGEFRPPEANIRSWKYLNTDASTGSDHLCSAEEIPLEPDSVDGFLLCDVLEHLERPEKVLREAFRILKPNGKGWITMPFLNQIHADPHDYQRWTESKLRNVLEQTGFSGISISPMGGIIAVIYDLCHAAVNRSTNQGTFINRLSRRLLQGLGPLALKLDRRFDRSASIITTGYAIVVSN